MATVRIRVRLVQFDAWRVLLPTYRWVNGSMRPVLAGRTHGDGVLPGVTLTPAEQNALSVVVETESEYLNDTQTQINQDAVRRAFGTSPVEALVNAGTLELRPRELGDAPEVIGR